jgi:DNA polymerase
MLVFGSKLYREKKYEIEHCEDQWMLTKATVTNTNCLHTNEVWFADDLLKGEANGLGIELAKTIDKEQIKDLKHLKRNVSRCESCELRAQCTKPVNFSIGELNILIVGEAPGYNEDRDGKGFVGKAGRLLWDDLKGYGLDRSQFHVTNICKCFPSEIKTPQVKHTRKCSQWLEREIEIVEPFLVLAFGNTGLKYFRDQPTGILEASGEVEWSDKHNCWICYCLHPAAILYHRENMPSYTKGIKSFIDKVGYLGFGL